MYCLQWLLPVLLISKPASTPLHLQNQLLFAVLYLVGALLERKPCMICLLLFLLTTAILLVPGLEWQALGRLFSLEVSSSSSQWTVYQSSQSSLVCS